MIRGGASVRIGKSLSGLAGLGVCGRAAPG